MSLFFHIFIKFKLNFKFDNLILFILIMFYILITMNLDIKHY